MIWMIDKIIDKKNVEIDNIVISRIFKALGDVSRLKILEQLNDGERCGCQLLTALDIGQSTLSHHMKILEEAGLLNCKKVGKWCRYTLNQEGWTKARSAIKKITENLGDL